MSYIAYSPYFPKISKVPQYLQNLQILPVFIQFPFYLQGHGQGRPVRALCDAQMHQGQSRGKQKTNKVCKKHVNFTKSEGKFAKVGE